MSDADEPAIGDVVRVTPVLRLWASTGGRLSGGEARAFEAALTDAERERHDLREKLAAAERERDEARAEVGGRCRRDGR